MQFDQGRWRRVPSRVINSGSAAPVSAARPEPRVAGVGRSPAARAVNTHPIPGVGAHRLTGLRPAHLEPLYIKMMRSGSSAGTAHQAHRTIRTALNETVRRGYIVRNPPVLAIGLPVELLELLLLEHRRCQAKRASRRRAAIESGRLRLEETVDPGRRDGRLYHAGHAAATVLLLLGVPERAVMGIMGWSHGGMVSRYQHMTAPVRREVAERFRRPALGTEGSGRRSRSAAAGRSTEAVSDSIETKTETR